MSVTVESATEGFPQILPDKYRGSDFLHQMIKDPFPRIPTSLLELCGATRLEKNFPLSPPFVSL